MSAIGTDPLFDLVAARRLIISAQENAARRAGKTVKEKSALEAMREDQALLSGEAAEFAAGARPTAPAQDETVIRLADLARPARSGSNSTAPQVQTAQIEYRQTQTLELQISARQLERVDGLVLRSKTLAETDRYTFEFSDGATFKISDKWSGRSTRIWGDPHVDTDDQEGDSNGEFSDLTGSDSHTTLVLQDGSRVTFTAQDRGIIERVDIFKDSQHLGGVGAGSKDFNEKNGLFAANVDSGSTAGSIPTGDTLYAGGDGNDWFNAAQQLIWGKTTGPLVSARPSAVLEFSYRQTITQSLSATFTTQA